MALRPAAALICGVLAASAQTDLPREVLLIARIKRHMAARLREAPNYTCVETIERMERSGHSPKYHPLDTLRLEVAEVDRKELFAWPGGRFEEKELSAYGGAGLMADGLFVTHARALFVNENATFTYRGEEELEGRTVARYDYHVALMQSGYWIYTAGTRARVAYRGSFWADAENLDLLRMTVEAEQIPVELGLSSADTEIAYQKVMIGGSEALLPRSAELTLTRFAGSQSRNRIEFNGCKQYGSDSVISFEEPAPAGAELDTARPPAEREFDLPAGLAMRLRLETPLNSSQAIVGLPLRATVEANVTHGGQVLIPKGSVVTGHFRGLEKVEGRRPYFVVSLEFSEVELGARRGRFLGSLEDIGPLLGLAANSMGPQVGVMTTKTPGVGTFFLRGGRFLLPRGLRMIWMTQAAARHGG